MNSSPCVLGRRPVPATHGGIKTRNEEFNEIKSLQEKVRFSLHKQALKYFKLFLGGNVFAYS